MIKVNPYYIPWPYEASGICDYKTLRENWKRLRKEHGELELKVERTHVFGYVIWHIKAKKMRIAGVDQILTREDFNKLFWNGEVK